MQVLVLAVFLSTASQASAQAAPDADTRWHHTLTGEHARAMPRTVLVVEPQISVFELSAGGVSEKVPERTRRANELFRKILAETFAGGRADVRFVAQPALSEEEQGALDEFVATYDVVAANAQRYTGSDVVGWEDRRARFDYSLGYGLAEIRQRTGAEAALITVGADFQSSGGRKAMAVLGMLAGVAIVPGYAVLRTGIVDLASGDILWMHNEGGFSGNLNDEADLRNFVQKALSTLPPPRERP